MPLVDVMRAPETDRCSRGVSGRTCDNLSLRSHCTITGAGELMRRLMLRPMLIVLLIPVPLMLWYAVPDQHVWRTRHSIGLVLVIAGAALWFAARWQLGAAFTPRAEARTLVTGGVYRFIRHPIYVGAEVVAAGLFVYMGLYPLLLLALISIPRQRQRARNEEAVLEAAFGDRYRSYRRSTWM